MKVKVSELVFIDIEVPRSVSERIQAVLALWANAGSVEHAMTGFSSFKVLVHNQKYYALEHFYFLREMQKIWPDQYVEITRVKSQQKRSSGLIEVIVREISATGLLGIDALDALALELLNVDNPKSYTVTKWAEALDCHRSTIYNRMKNLNEVKVYESDAINPIDKSFLIGDTPEFPTKGGQL